VSALLVLALASGCAAVATSGTPAVEPTRTPGASIAPTPTPLPTATATPAAPPTPALTPTPAALIADSCVDRDVPAPPTSDPTLIVLDRTYALDQFYAPDLVPIGETGFDGQQLVATAAVADLGALYRDVYAAGLSLLVDSAFRSYDQQQVTFDHWVAQQGFDAALLRTARPGHSEHQLGTAIDFSSPGWTGRFGDWASETVEGAWLFEHAWEYGFVLSYPWAAEAVTCFGYEPWHYRWIGRAAAAEQHASGELLRTFLERYVVPPS
jgi:D-alanyl-D-alanine carboxypeptidase